MAILKAPKHKSYLRLSTRDKYVVQLQDQLLKLIGIPKELN